MTENKDQTTIESTLIRLLLGLQERKQTGEVVPYDYWKPLHEHFKDRYPLGQHHCTLSYWRDLVQISPILAANFAIKSAWRCECTGSKQSIDRQLLYITWNNLKNQADRGFQSKLQRLIIEQIEPSGDCSDCQNSYQLFDWQAPGALSVQFGGLHQGGHGIPKQEGDIPRVLTLEVGKADLPVNYALQAAAFHSGTSENGHDVNCSKRGGQWFWCHDEDVKAQSEGQINTLLNKKFRDEHNQIAHLIYACIDSEKIGR